MNEPQSPSINNITLSSTATPDDKKSNIKLNDEFADCDEVSALKEEQENVDKILNFLLSYKCTKKNRGRPPNNPPSSQNSLKVPDAVPDDLKTLTNINDIHAGVLLDYLKKVNSLNKKLLLNYEILNNKYDSLAASVQIKNQSPVNTNHLASPINVPAQIKQSSESKLIPKLNPNEREEFELKVDALEQKSNSNILICSGKVISDVISHNNDSIDIKNEIFSKVKAITTNIKEADIGNIHVFGKDKKVVKIICSSLNVKRTILNEFRNKKPQDIFIAEYLTSFRSKLYFELRQLKKLYPTKIYSTYISNGNLYYKLSNDVTKFFNIRQPRDIFQLRKQFNENTNDSILSN